MGATEEAATDATLAIEYSSLRAMYEAVRTENSITYSAFVRKLHRLEQGNPRTLRNLGRRMGIAEVEVKSRVKFRAPQRRSRAKTVQPLIVECVECSASITTERRPRLYCSDRCRQTLKLVHYGRRVFRDGRIADPLVKDAIGTRIAFIVAGGYPERQRALPAKARAAIFERDASLCQLCGKPATQIDHIRGDSSDPSNLRALCADCNWAEAHKRMRPATKAEQAVIDSLVGRILSDEPQFERDDETGWTVRYREIQREQRQRMRGLGAVEAL
ncbi:MAG: HNH endonuclease [Candidatus Limnocylindrales bacterium]